MKINDLARILRIASHRIKIALKHLENSAFEPLKYDISPCGRK